MNLDEMIAAERSAPAEATKTQKAEMWRSIEHSFVTAVPSAGAPAAAAKASTLGKLGGALSTTVGKVVLATTLVTGGAVGVSRLNAGNNDTPATVRSTAERGTERVAVNPPVQTPASPPQERAALAPAPAPERQAAPATTRAKPARVRPAAKPTSSVQEELALIRQAQSAVRNGEHKRALNLARQHATTYPDGAFVEDREALRALALCDSGNATGSAAASKFYERWPKSMHRSRIEAACE